MTEPNCSGCPLNGQPKVYGEFDPLHPTEDSLSEPLVAMVGMAPAREELIQGRVFVGISGQILRAVNERLGYRNIYICNCLLCELPEVISDEDRVLALRCCRPRLLSELRELLPGLDLIVALGAMPLSLLIGNYSIIKVAGRVFPTDFTLHQIRPVLPAIHPAYVWRNPDDFYDYVEQMSSGIRWLKGTYQSAVAPTTVIVTRDNIEEVLDIIGTAEIGSLDLETTGGGFYPYGGGDYPYGSKPDQIRCIVLSIDTRTSYIFPGFHCDRSNPYWVEGETEYENILFYPRLKAIIESKKWRMHSGQFDCAFLLQIGIKAILYFDSMLAHYTTDEREYVHSLKRISHKYLGAPDWEDDVKTFLTKKKDTYDKIPNSRIFVYAAHDGIYTNQISERLEEETKDTWALHHILHPAANMFNELRHRGIRIDPRELMRLDETLEAEVAQVEDELNELCGEPLNPSSPPEVMEFLYDKMRYPIHPRYGRTSNKKALQWLMPDPVVEKIINCRHLNKLKGTYVESLARFVDDAYRIHPNTKLFSSVTGRVSTEDPSVMNVSKMGGIMRIYLPDKGNKIGVFDFKGMELRCGALETGDEHLKEILLDPTRDPHKEAATEAYSTEQAGEKRGPIKTVVFGRMYGRQEEGIMYGLRLTKQETRHLVEVVDGFFPGLPLYQARIDREIRENGYLESYFGRLRRFGLITRENLKEYRRQGYNFPIQSMASDINLLCMLYLFSIKEELDIYPLWPIHDAILMDLGPGSSVPKIKKIVEDYASSLVKGEMAFPVDVKVGDNWGDAIIWKEEGE